MNKQLMTTTGMTRSFHYPLICGVITLCISSIASAQTEQSAAVNSIAEFDSSFLVGDAKKIDVKKSNFSRTKQSFRIKGFWK